MSKRGSQPRMEVRILGFEPPPPPNLQLFDWVNTTDKLLTCVLITVWRGLWQSSEQPTPWVSNWQTIMVDPVKARACFTQYSLIHAQKHAQKQCPAGKHVKQNLLLRNSTHLELDTRVFHCFWMYPWNTERGFPRICKRLPWIFSSNNGYICFKNTLHLSNKMRKILPVTVSSDGRVTIHHGDGISSRGGPFSFRFHFKCLTKQNLIGA